MAEQKHYTVHKFSLETVYQKLEKRIIDFEIELLSVDIFDTLLVRKEENEDKRFWEVSELISKKFKIDSNLLFQARKFAHKSAYSINRNGEAEATFTDILNIMIQYLGLEKKIFKELLKIEIEYEFNSLDVNEHLLALLKTAHIPYLFASDMYLEKQHIYELFDKFELALNPIDILVSSSLHLSKRNSGLYVYLKDKYPNKKIMQIGDNRISDIRNAESHDIKTFWIRHTNV